MADHARMDSDPPADDPAPSSGGRAEPTRIHIEVRVTANTAWVGGGHPQPVRGTLALADGSLLTHEARLSNPTEGKALPLDGTLSWRAATGHWRTITAADWEDPDQNLQSSGPPRFWIRDFVGNPILSLEGGYLVSAEEAVQASDAMLDVF